MTTYFWIGILLNITLISRLSAQYTGGVDTGYRPYDEFNAGLDTSFYLTCTYLNGCKVFTDALLGNDPPELVNPEEPVCNGGCVRFRNRIPLSGIPSFGTTSCTGGFYDQRFTFTLSNVEYMSSIDLPDLFLSTSPWCVGAGCIPTGEITIPSSCLGTVVINDPSGLFSINFTSGPCTGNITITIDYGLHLYSSAIDSFTLPIVICPNANATDQIAGFSEFLTIRACPDVDSCSYFSFGQQGMPITCSFDPNTKATIPQGCGPRHLIPASTKSLIYRIIFQNIGSSPATKVRVVDSLPAQVDPNSIKVLYSSHHQISGLVAGGVFESLFDTITLAPASIDSAGSIGWIVCEAKLKPNLPVGTEIRNRAYIYFDSNPAIITPDVFHTIQDSPAKVVVVPCSALCAGDSVLLTAVPAGGSYVWSNGATTQSIWVHSAGTYTVSAIYPYTCQPSADSCTVAVAETLHSGVARKTYNPGTWYDVSFSLAKSVYVEVPAELPVILGNAGNHWAWLYITDSAGNKDTITYRGGSSQAHPVGSVQIAKGLKYHFNKGSNGLVAGSIVDAVAVRLRINGSWRHGETNVALKLEGSCSPPVGKAETAISWQNAENSIEMPGISIYPNPATGNLVWLEWGESEHSLLEIYDVTGRLMIQTKPVNELDISSLAKGMYVLKFGKSSVRLIRE